NSVDDQPTTDDTLGFTPYVAAVAAFLTHEETKPPLTLSIEGAWGSGKSSFMLQLRDRLEWQEAKTVWFNALRHEREDGLWAAFALDFMNNLASTVPLVKRLYLHLKLRCRRFDWRRGWLVIPKFLALLLAFAFVSTIIVQNLRDSGSPLRQFFAAAQRQTD